MGVKNRYACTLSNLLSAFTVNAQKLSHYFLFAKLIDYLAIFFPGA